MLTSGVLGPVDPLVLQGAIERFRPRVIEACSGTPNGPEHTQFAGYGGEFSRNILRASITVENGLTRTERSVSSGHPQCIGNKFGAHNIGYRVDLVYRRTTG